MTDLQLILSFSPFNWRLWKGKWDGGLDLRFGPFQIVLQWPV